MYEDNLNEFMNERVLATRQIHKVDYPSDPLVAVGVVLNCDASGLRFVILPVVTDEIMHLEVHAFVGDNHVSAHVVDVPGRGFDVTLVGTP